MRFIRKNGRVIPLRDRVSLGVEKGAGVGAVSVGTAYGVLTHIATKEHNPFGIVFWGLKGAIAGGAIGGVAGALNRHMNGNAVQDHQAAKRTFMRSLALSSAGSVLHVAAPFVSRNKRVKTAVQLGASTAFIGSMANAVVSSALANKGNRGVVLAAGGAGSVLGTNFMRLGKPIISNRKKLGLRRI